MHRTSPPHFAPPTRRTEDAPGALEIPVIHESRAMRDLIRGLDLASRSCRGTHLIADGSMAEATAVAMHVAARRRGLDPLEVHTKLPHRIGSFMDHEHAASLVMNAHQLTPRDALRFARSMATGAHGLVIFAFPSRRTFEEAGALWTDEMSIGFERTPFIFPSLCEREADHPGLISALAAHLEETHGGDVSFPPEFTAYLKDPWSKKHIRNVRELYSWMRRAFELKTRSGATTLTPSLLWAARDRRLISQSRMRAADAA